MVRNSLCEHISVCDLTENQISHLTPDRVSRRSHTYKSSFEVGELLFSKATQSVPGRELCTDAHQRDYLVLLILRRYS